MKFQSAILSSASGRLGGAIFRSTRHGNVVSKYSTRILHERKLFYGKVPNPSRPPMVSNKRFMLYVANAWRSMSPTYRPIWEERAKMFGMDTYNYFVFQNFGNMLCGIGITDSIGDFSEHYHCQGVTATFYQSYAYASADNASLVPAFGNTTTLVSDQFATPQKKIPPLLAIGIGEYNPPSEVWAIDSNFESIWGVLNEGWWIYVRVYVIDTNTASWGILFQGWQQVKAD